LRAGAHRGYDDGRLIHFPDRKNCDVASIDLDQLDGADGTLRFARINVYHRHFRPRVLYLAQYRVSGRSRKADMAENHAAHAGLLQTVLEHWKPVPVFGQKSYRYSLHGLTLCPKSVCY
jgi:hypothetical protein